MFGLPDYSDDVHGRANLQLALEGAHSERCGYGRLLPTRHPRSCGRLLRPSSHRWSEDFLRGLQCCGFERPTCAGCSAAHNSTRASFEMHVDVFWFFWFVGKIKHTYSLCLLRIFFGSRFTLSKNPQCVDDGTLTFCCFRGWSNDPSICAGTLLPRCYRQPTGVEDHDRWENTTAVTGKVCATSVAYERQDMS